jgi:superfamily II DNA or RNA helicase
MPVTLHAIWLPGGPLALWAEGEREHAARSVYAHPFALGADELDGLLWPMWPGRPANVLLDRGHSLVLALPSTGDRPLASWTGMGARPRGPAEPVTLQPWRVDVCLAAAVHALAFLLRAPETDDAPARLGDSLRFWQRAARLAGAALVRGEYLPSADDDGRGLWRLAFVSPDLQSLAAQLAAAMPPAARALGQPLPPAPALLADFLETVGHTVASQAYAPEASPFYDPRRHAWKHADPRPADQWWLDLFPRTRYALPPRVAPGDQQAFRERVRAWADASRSYLAGDYRLALRLEPPAVATPPDENAPLPADWLLTFHLQPRSETGMLWAAREVWDTAPSPEMPGLLHAGLEQAAALCPLLVPALDEPDPECARLTVRQAQEFLETYAAELGERGFGVLVPSWWKQRAPRLKTRLALGRPLRGPGGRGEGRGLLGMDALVDFNWELAIGDQTLSVDEFARLAQAKTALVQVRGEWMQLDPQQVQAALKLMQRHQKSQGKLALGEALSLALAAEDEWEGLAIDTVAVDGWLDEAVQRLNGRHALEALPQPPGFAGELRHYQLVGLSWLAFMRQWGFGACLADDMGLGKTIMVLALLAHDLAAGALLRPVLLVCPTTVVANWEREAARFVPALRVYAHHGPARPKGAAFAERVAAHHLVVTSYPLLVRDRELLAGQTWDGLVLDEAHNIKNPATKQAQAARAVGARYRIGLTGTPLENRLQDLWSIMHFLNPGFLGSAESFQRRFATPIERDQDAHAVARLRGLAGPFLLRRVKSDPAVIQDLPPKNEMKEYCGLTKEQAALYRAVVQESLRQIAGAQGIRRRGAILATLTKLKQVCNHPRHLLNDGSALALRSGKLNRLSEMLEQAVAEDDRVLIFTQYAEMGALLQAHLSESFGETLYLYGGTPTHERTRLIERFQAGEARLFVLSLKAGGAGINLTRANRVFHYDRWWNPAVENQATDRAFRIGQTQPVQVHKMICRGTLEERIDELITRKLALAQNIVGAGEDWLTELSTEELRDLLVLRREAVDD